MHHFFRKICLVKLWGITYTHPSGNFVPKLLLCMIIRMYYYVEYMCLDTLAICFEIYIYIMRCVVTTIKSMNKYS